MTLMSTPPPQVLKLDQFLKLSRIVETGGQAKLLIQSGQVWVNGQVETRRGRKLYPGDRVQVGELILQVVVEQDPEDPEEQET